jgi:transposase
MGALWAGIDAGKRAHHCVVMDAGGTVVFSRRVDNDEQQLSDLLAAVLALADGDPVVWGTDLNAGGAALLIALLEAHGQQLLYIPGRIVHHASATYRGDGKTDAKDARIIADQARMRRDLTPVRSADQQASDLRLLTSHRTDLTYDRVRMINRMRALLLEYFPALEAAFDYSKKAPLILLTGYATPDALRRMGAVRLAAWLRARGCRNSTAMADKALVAAHAQHTTLRTQATGARLVADLAAKITALDGDIAALDAQIAGHLDTHADTAIITSMPGFGPLLAATFIANTGGAVDTFGSVNRLACFAGVAPVPRDSGRIAGNHHRPRRYNRRLMRTCYLAALSSLKNSAASRAFYDRKRAEGKSHKQALIALARRRLDTLWAMLRDRTTYREPTPADLAPAA